MFKICQMAKMISSFIEFQSLFRVDSGAIGEKKGAKIEKTLFHISDNYKFKPTLNQS